MPAAVLEAVGPLDRQAYRESLRGVMDGLDSLNGRADREVVSLFGDLRRHTADILSDLGETPSGPLYARTLEGLDASMTDFANRWTLRFDVLQDEGFDMGEELAGAPLEAGLPDFGIARLGPTTDQLRILAQFRTDLVGGVTTELHNRIRREVAAVSVGAKSFTDAATAIGRNLTDRNHFSTMMHRARAIMVTEIGRASSLATQSTQERAAEVLPTLRKRWLNAHLPGARQTHLAAEARYAENGIIGPIPVDEPYSIAGISAMYPHDPSLPARESVHCHCVSISVLVEPGADPEPVDPAEITEPLTDQDEIRQEEDDEPIETPREAENRARYERLAEPMVKPADWDKMSNPKRLKWLEDQMEADFPLGEEWRDKAITHTRKRVPVVDRAGNPVLDLRTGKQRTRMTTVREVIEKVKGSDLKTAFDLKGMDADLALDSMQELRRLTSAFPEVGERLAYVGTYRGTKGLEWKIRRARQWSAGQWAHASTDGRRLGFNPGAYQDGPKMMNALRDSWSTGFHPTASIESNVVHEFGHQVDNWIRRNSGKSLIPLGARADGFGHLGETMSNMRRQFATSGGGYGGVSRYSMHSDAEGWAESFDAWWHRKRQIKWVSEPEFGGLAERTITGARPLNTSTFGDAGETWLTRQGRFLDLLEGVRLDDLPDYVGLDTFQSLGNTDRITHAALRNQLLEDLGGEFGDYRLLDIGYLTET